MSSCTPNTWIFPGSAAPAMPMPWRIILRRKYAGTKIDAIITVYPAALDFLMGEEGKVFPGVPIVASEIIRDYCREPGPFPVAPLYHRRHHGRQHRRHAG